MRPPRTARGRLTAVLVAAAALAAILVGASQVTARDAESRPASEADAPAPAVTHRRTHSLFAGIEQKGNALGSPKAPVTLVEYADLQCPYCAQWARDTLPTLVEKHVKTGNLRIVFRGMAFVGPDSDKALRTAIAAGEHNRLFDVVHGLYRHQGEENAGWVTDELVDKIAAEAGLDGNMLLERRSSSSVDTEIARAAAAAQAAGIQSTPSFDLGPTGGPLEPIHVSSLGPEGIVPAIEAALAQ